MNKDIGFVISAFVFVLLSLTTNAQLPNLCGLWFGYGYQCYTVDTHNNLTINNVPYEFIQITQNANNEVEALKLIGDNCVSAGQTTWTGKYNAPEFDVSLKVGSPDQSGAFTVDDKIMVIDENTLTVIGNNNLYYKRATCEQLDTMTYQWEVLPVISCVNCPAEILMPNIFSPNNDNINDQFAPITYKHVKTSYLKIYDRWGNEVFNVQNNLKGWNGEHKDKECVPGIYFWLLTYTNKTNKQYHQTGTVTLVR